MLVPPPKYFVDKLVPKVKVARKASLAGMFIIERAAENGIRPIENGEALEILLKNCEDAYGFPPYDKIKDFLCCNSGIDLPEREQSIIHQAFGPLEVKLARSDHYDWWSRILPNIDEQLSGNHYCVDSVPELFYVHEGA
jgi:hypothetical protein